MWRITFQACWTWIRRLHRTACRRFRTRRIPWDYHRRGAISLIIFRPCARTLTLTWITCWRRSTCCTTTWWGLLTAPMDYRTMWCRLVLDRFTLTVCRLAFLVFTVWAPTRWRTAKRVAVVGDLSSVYIFANFNSSLWIIQPFDSHPYKWRLHFFLTNLLWQYDLRNWKSEI